MHISKRQYKIHRFRNSKSNLWVKTQLYFFQNSYNILKKSWYSSALKKKRKKICAVYIGDWRNFDAFCFLFMLFIWCFLSSVEGTILIVTGKFFKVSCCVEQDKKEKKNEKTLTARHQTWVQINCNFVKRCESCRKQFRISIIFAAICCKGDFFHLMMIGSNESPDLQGIFSL